jgi:hypothetical protein
MREGEPCDPDFQCSTPQDEGEQERASLPTSGAGLTSAAQTRVEWPPLLRVVVFCFMPWRELLRWPGVLLEDERMRRSARQRRAGRA